MAANEVALALSISNPKNAMSDGTIIIPPPMPNRPDSIPAIIPTTKIPISIFFYFKPFIAKVIELIDLSDYI